MCVSMFCKSNVCFHVANHFCARISSGNDDADAGIFSGVKDTENALKGFKPTLPPSITDPEGVRVPLGRT